MGETNKIVWKLEDTKRQSGLVHPVPLAGRYEKWKGPKQKNED